MWVDEDLVPKKRKVTEVTIKCNVINVARDITIWCHVMLLYLNQTENRLHLWFQIVP